MKLGHCTAKNKQTKEVLKLNSRRKMARPPSLAPLTRLASASCPSPRRPRFTKPARAHDRIFKVAGTLDRKLFL